MPHKKVTAADAGSITIGGELRVNRLGFGAMRLTGPGIWGDPADPEECIRVLRRAVQLEVNFIDTADSYGPFVSEMLIKKALHPYPDGLVIATKAGLTRTSPNDWPPIGRPEYLRQQVHLSLRHLGVDRIDLLQFHRIDPKVPLEESVGELARLKEEGKIRFIGLSNVTVQQYEAASRIAPIVSVQNRYNLTDRDSERMLEYAQDHDVAFIPWFPLAAGRVAQVGSVLARMAREFQVTPAQLALAWLLKRSPVMLPIPGTSTVAHLEENIAAAGIELSEEEYESLTQAV